MPAQGELHEAIREAYGAYARAYMMEFGYAIFGPVQMSLYASARVKAEGTLEQCVTPMDLLGRIFDREALEALEYTVLDMSAR